MSEDLSGAPVGFIEATNRASLDARPWRKPGYLFRCASIHDAASHLFYTEHPYAGWAHVAVDDIALAMLTANDDGVALLYHAFGPDAYESASVAAWVAIARTCDQVADIGAFTGLYALLAKKAAPGATVVAVEPNSASRARIFTNCVWNGLHLQVKVAPYAVSSALDAVTLYVPMGADLLDTGASLVRTDQASRTEMVTAAPIDAILAQYDAPRPDLMKIDVEGLEVAALQGAKRSLEGRPTLLLEVQTADLYARCREILAPLGYRLFGIDDETLTLIDDDPSIPLQDWFAQNVRGRALNYLCLARDEHLALARRGIARVHAMLGRPMLDAEPGATPIASPDERPAPRVWRWPFART